MKLILEIPTNLHNKFKDYPLCPEIKSIYQKIIYLNIKLI